MSCMSCRAGFTRFAITGCGITASGRLAAASVACWLQRSLGRRRPHCFQIHPCQAKRRAKRHSVPGIRSRRPLPHPVPTAKARTFALLKASPEIEVPNPLAGRALQGPFPLSSTTRDRKTFDVSHPEGHSRAPNAQWLPETSSDSSIQTNIGEKSLPHDPRSTTALRSRGFSCRLRDSKTLIYLGDCFLLCQKIS